MQRATLTFCSCSAPCPLQREREVEGARDDRKRGYNSLAGQEVDVTPEEMEAYRLYTVVPRLLRFIEDLTNWCAEDQVEDLTNYISESRR